MSDIANETKQIQAVYGNNDIAGVLQIKESTLRKYCVMLEKSGYEFLKNEHGHRAFFDNDVIVLRKMISLKNDADMTLEEAVKAVVAWKNGNDVVVSDTEEKPYITRYSDLMEEFKTFQEQQLNFNKELIQEIRSQSQEIRRQREYIEHRLEERDRLLIESIRTSLEVRKEIAATQKKKWWQFWRGSNDE